MKNPYFGRLLTAMVTPFAQDGSVNYKAACDLAEWQINHGTDALVVCGSTGEAATMSMEERLELYRQVIKRNQQAGADYRRHRHKQHQQHHRGYSSGGRGGCGRRAGVGPYYNKPTQEGYYQHFAAVAKSTTLPIIVYNVPGRTGGNIAPATVARLARDFKNIVAIKEAAGNVDQVAELYRTLPPDFTIYSGDDILILPFMSVGATGLVSVLSNLGGKLLNDVMNAYQAGKVQEAAYFNSKMVPVAHAMFIETNPIP
jgi:4-hydroxy-tetrahydrodipicolinate synthase